MAEVEGGVETRRYGEITEMPDLALLQEFVDGLLGHSVTVIFNPANGTFERTGQTSAASTNVDETRSN